MRRKSLSVSLLLLSVLLALQCTTPTDSDTAGNSSQTPNSAVSGILYQPDGITPAAGVPVKIRPKNTLADTVGFGGLPKRLVDTMTVTTDNAGQRYTFPRERHEVRTIRGEVQAVW